MTNTDIVDNWEEILVEDFESTFPDTACFLRDESNDGLERLWGRDESNRYGGMYAAWPAAGGQDRVDPTAGKYPANLDSWFICGPYDMTNAKDLLVTFDYWLDIEDQDDAFFVGVSVDGQVFTGVSLRGRTWWRQYNVWFPSTGGRQQVWVAWAFKSDGDDERAKGVWIDNLQVWRYNTPDVMCGKLDPGGKGIVLPPYEAVGELIVPMIRYGDTVVVDKIVEADADWVRLGFIQINGLLDIQAYDRMVDTLCARGISLLGLVNHETLDREGFNDVTKAAEYRQAFADVVAFLVDHFEGRITYWEVWNEENLDEDPANSFEPPYMNPRLYAHLLNTTYEAIKATTPQAKVIFGGLASAWEDSWKYFLEVYDE